MSETRCGCSIPDFGCSRVSVDAPALFAHRPEPRGSLPFGGRCGPRPNRGRKSGTAFAGFASGGFPTSTSSSGSIHKRWASMPSLTRVVVPATGEDGDLITTEHSDCVRSTASRHRRIRGLTAPGSPSRVRVLVRWKRKPDGQECPSYGAGVGPRDARESCVAWWFLEQQFEEHSLGQSEQEHARQPEQQQRFPGGDLFCRRQHSADCWAGPTVDARTGRFTDRPGVPWCSPPRIPRRFPCLFCRGPAKGHRTTARAGRETERSRGCSFPVGVTNPGRDTCTRSPPVSSSISPSCCGSDSASIGRKTCRFRMPAA